MRPIDADALEKDANEDLLSDTDTVEEVYWNDGAKSIIDLIKTAPTIEPKKGKWIYHEPLDVFECSVCGRQMVRNIFNYCPWCGARMENGDE